MAQFTYTIPNEKLSDLVSAVVWAFPVPQILNPTYDPNSANPEDHEKYINEFTDNVWTQKAIRKWLINLTQRYQIASAEQAIMIAKDEGLIDPV